ncbi:hypothetical protein NA56DRAFT_650578 [Hyaloscypha hepaticicola]|uniref:Uncharacterized protein n=1 Tax=Hyaloscypha hepaticicola TaxID=2082293 RepID=A0A2J6PLM9_9HELO|nr:hypothetical protein NA56DRAFT_650578 [Hyaloscypha hepaticicola]
MDYVSFFASLILFRIWRGQGLCAEVYDRGGRGDVRVLEKDRMASLARDQDACNVLCDGRMREFISNMQVRVVEDLERQ